MIDFNAVYGEFANLLESLGFRKVLKKETLNEARTTVSWHLSVGKSLPVIEQFTEGNVIVIMLVVKFLCVIWILQFFPKYDSDKWLTTSSLLKCYY